MKEVPLEIDDLMWRLAEEANPVAREEFEARHTRYGPELSRRIRMVDELRRAGKAVSRRPAFTPRPARAAVPRAAVGATLALAVLAVGAVAYVVASGGEKAVEAKPIPSPPRIIVAPPAIPPVVQKTPVTTPEPKKPKIEEPEKAPVAARPVDLQIKDTDLAGAIRLVAQAGGLDVTLAPGFPERRVTFDYGSLTPLDTLKTMGENYGFSVIEEEAGQYLVVPARETASNRRVGL